MTSENLCTSMGAKKALSGRVSNPGIEKLYNNALNAGATGGKLGAGGGGFFLLFVSPRKQQAVKKE